MRSKRLAAAAVAFGLLAGGALVPIAANSTEPVDLGLPEGLPTQAPPMDCEGRAVTRGILDFKAEAIPQAATPVEAVIHTIESLEPGLTIPPALAVREHLVEFGANRWRIWAAQEQGNWVARDFASCSLAGDAQ